MSVLVLLEKGRDVQRDRERMGQTTQLSSRAGRARFHSVWLAHQTADVVRMDTWLRANGWEKIRKLLN